MGATQCPQRHSSEPGPQVRERHVRALYINIPVRPDVLRSMLLPPAEPDIFNDSAWISVVVDDLFKFEAPVGPAFMAVPFMNSWMMKVNALIKCAPHPEAEVLHGYQILSLDFEQTRGLSGWIKKQGARATQKIPSRLARFAVSSGASGSTATSAMDDGTCYSSVVTSTAAESDGAGQDCALVQVQGKLAPLNVAAGEVTSADFVDFVVNRPHKFLAQRSGTSEDSQLAFASWREGYDCSSTGCMRVVLEEISLPVLSRLGEEVGREMDADLANRAVCFLQPEYSLVDCKNTRVQQ